MAFAFLAGGSHVCAHKRETKITGDPRKDGFVVKVYLRGVHNLMEAPEPEGSTWIRSKRFVPGLFEEKVEWMVRQSRSAGVEQKRSSILIGPTDNAGKDRVLFFPLRLA
ncbi:MAG: hypothetical protein ACXW6T_20745 [Candidatus Binatia bacterium]